MGIFIHNILPRLSFIIDSHSLYITKNYINESIIKCRDCCEYSAWIVLDWVWRGAKQRTDPGLFFLPLATKCSGWIWVGCGLTLQWESWQKVQMGIGFGITDGVQIRATLTDSKETE